MLRPRAIPPLAVLLALQLGCENPVDDSPVLGGGAEPTLISFYFNSPAWHPAGKWIAAEHQDSVDTDGDGLLDDSYGGIWLVHATTGWTKPLIRGFGNPAWSSDGSHLAMESSGQIFTVVVTHLDSVTVGTNSLSQLTFEGRNFFPDWSPDGRRIVYDSNFNDGTYNVWIIDADGSNKVSISAGQFGRIPNWSPDGNWIAHERSGTTLTIMDTAGANAKLLGAGSYPRYSPNGTKIGFYLQPRVGAPALWIMRPDGSNLRKVSPEYAWRFDWSHDGSSLVFLYWDFLEDRQGNGELWLINTDGSNLKQLTHMGS